MAEDEPNSHLEPGTDRGPIQVYGPSLFAKPAELKRLGGSDSDFWNNQIANQAINTLHSPRAEQGEASQSTKAAIVGLAGINPRDEIEGMLAAQLLAGHNAAMECYRRAALPNIHPELRHDHLNRAGKLSRTFTMLVETLNRHRGKGQQKVTVEHVHVHSGGQAIVGNIETAGGGVHRNSEDQPHARQIENARQPSMRSANPQRSALPVTCNAKRSLSDARGAVTRRPKGK